MVLILSSYQVMSSNFLAGSGYRCVGDRQEVAGDKSGDPRERHRESQGGKGRMGVRKKQGKQETLSHRRMTQPLVDTPNSYKYMQSCARNTGTHTTQRYKNDTDSPPSQPSLFLSRKHT
jgi:uncharacterized protein (DUF2252 family)